MDDEAEAASAERDAEPAPGGMRGWAVTAAVYIVSAVLYYLVASGRLP